MLQEFQSHNHSDEEQNPTGGYATAEGIDIRWQHGPLGPHPHEEGERDQPNGAFVETVLAIARDRLQFFQSCGGPEGTLDEGKFACVENAEAIAAITDALEWLDKRTTRRTEQGIEGTHTPDPT